MAENNVKYENQVLLQPIWSGSGRDVEAARREKSRVSAESAGMRKRVSAESAGIRSRATGESAGMRSRAAGESVGMRKRAVGENVGVRSRAVEESVEVKNRAAAGGRRKVYRIVEEPGEAFYSREDWRRVAAGRRRRSRKGRFAGSFLKKCCVLLVLLGLFYLMLPYLCVKRELNMEAGMPAPGVKDFLNWGGKGARIVSGLEENTRLERVGNYDFVIQVYGRKVSAVLHVRAGRPTAVYVNDGADMTAQGGSSTLPAAGNEGNTPPEGTVPKDTEPPVIQGVKELTMTAGSSISYKKGITVTDNVDQNVKLNVDTSAVDTDKPGNYTIVYSAVDSAGNRASVSTVLHVMKATIELATEESVNAEADKILASLLTSDMSQLDQAKAIYDWCHSKIAYSDGTPKTTWVEGAYRGLVDRKGDCYVYAATAKCLLTRAEIKNMDIERIPSGNSMHYWNLIDIGEGWRHFDTCRRKDGSTFFYKTDAEIKEYSDAHNGTHNYDRELYPEID